MTDFIRQLPIECQSFKIEQKNKVALDHFILEDGTVWVVLLTKMPGRCNKAWKMSKREYWNLQPKHGTRDRFIRENFTPTLTGKANPKQSLLSF